MIVASGEQLKARQGGSRRLSASAPVSTHHHMAQIFSIATFADASRIGELHRLVTAAFAGLPIDPPSSVLKETAADFLDRLKNETAIVATAGDDTLVGSVFCAKRERSLYVGRLAVRNDFRRQGVASALLDAAKREGRRLGLERLTLSTRIALESNVALFRKHGFQVVAEQSHAGFWQPTSYEMELVLG